MTLPTALNAILTIMMAKFMLNDVPHAVGLTNQPQDKRSLPSTFGAVNREQTAHDFLLPYLRKESEDITFGVDIFEIEGYPHPTYGMYGTGDILMYIHPFPVEGEVYDSLRLLAHEIGHHRTIRGVVKLPDEEAQAKSVGKHLMRKWLGT